MIKYVNGLKRLKNSKSVKRPLTCFMKKVSMLYTLSIIISKKVSNFLTTAQTSY